MDIHNTRPVETLEECLRRFAGQATFDNHMYSRLINVVVIGRTCTSGRRFVQMLPSDAVTV